MSLPPGQHATRGFPRFGTHLHRPPPAVPPDPRLTVAGPLREPLSLPLSALGPRTERVSDFHCVSGWSATGLRWGGVPFAEFFRGVVEPALRPGAEITHASFHGLDGFRAVLLLKDALADDVLLADRLDGRPLDGDHGAPLRLMSPGQYGFMSAKHLCRIELHTTAPDAGYGAPFRWMELALRHLITTHPRARVWEEERHRHLPGAVVRPVYGLLIPAIRRLSARGRRR